MQRKLILIVVRIVIRINKILINKTHTVSTALREKDVVKNIKNTLLRISCI